MSWFVHVSTPDAWSIPDREFPTMEAALSHVGETYLAEPSNGSIDNAQCCISDGKLKFIAFRSIFCKFKIHHSHLYEIHIAERDAFEAWHMNSLSDKAVN